MLFLYINSSLIVEALQNKVSGEFDSLTNDSSCGEIATAVTNSNLSKVVDPIYWYKSTCQMLPIFDVRNVNEIIISDIVFTNANMIWVTGGDNDDFETWKAGSGAESGGSNGTIIQKITDTTKSHTIDVSGYDYISILFFYPASSTVNRQYEAKGSCTISGGAQLVRVKFTNN